MKLWKQAAALAVIALGGAAIYVLTAPSGDDAPAQGAARAEAAAQIKRAPKATDVIARPARFSAQATRIEAVGTAEAIRSATLYPASAGQVRAVAFAPDEVVKEGDVLIELDRRAETLALSLARVRAKDARQLLERYRRASAGGSGAVSGLQIDQARTALEEARIQASQAEVSLADRYVRAPFDGRIGVTDVDIGDRIGTTDAIAVIDDRSALKVSFRVPEAFLRRVGIGQPITVAAWADPEAPPIQGEVIEIGSRIDPATRSFEARARVPNADDRLRPGMGFRIVLELKGQNYLLAPEAAVQWGAAGPYLWVIRNGKARRQTVRLVERREGPALVAAPVKEGEMIVVEGIQRMRNGLEVRAVEDGAPQS